jgi:hypothetical protein
MLLSMPMTHVSPPSIRFHPCCVLNFMCERRVPVRSEKKERKTFMEEVSGVGSFLFSGNLEVESHLIAVDDRST